MIGADFGIERRFQINDLSAKPSYHFGDNVIGANPQPLADDLYGQMPISKMPRNTQKIRRNGGRNFEQRLGGGADPKVAATLQFETVTLSQKVRARQIQQVGLPRSCDEANATPMPVDRGERHFVERCFLRPCPPSMHRNRPPHR